MTFRTATAAILPLLVLLCAAGAAHAEETSGFEKIFHAFHSGDYEDVLELTEGALEKKGLSKQESARLYFLAAEAHFLLGENGAAAAAYRQVITLRPKASPALVGLGRAEERLGHLDKAAGAFRKAYALDPKDADVRLALGEHLGRTGEYEEARKHLDAAAAGLKDSPRVSRAYVELDLRVDQGKQAMARADALVKSKPKHPMGHFLRGLALDRAGKGEEAIAAYEQAVKLDDDFVDAHKNLAILCHTDNPTYADLERTRKSMKHYERYFALGGRDPQLGKLYRTTLSFVSGFLDADPRGTPYFRDAAKSAKQVALQWALGILTADFDLIERSIDWKGLHARNKARGKDAAKDADTLRRKLLKQYRAALKPQGPKPMLEPALQQREGKLTEKQLDDGSVVVSFPQELGVDHVVARETKGVWRIIELPANKGMPSGSR